ncbi:MAG: glutamate ligase domain-containing protein, partial [Planctomycetota bacterium]
GQQVNLFYRGEFVTRCKIALPGEHNRRNWLAALVGAVTCGVDLETAVAAASSFQGMRRRFEYRGYWNQTHWIDDYAHHPTAIRETLKTTRATFPTSRVIAIVEPHQISRTEHLFSDYVESLTSADEVLLLPVLPARENASLADCLRLSARLVRKISESGGRAMLAANLDQVLGRLDHAVRPEDVVITMGAGRTHTIHDEIHRRLQRNSAA